jgi:hypothetical protein
MLLHNQEYLPITHYPQLHRLVLRVNYRILGVFTETNICVNGDMSQDVNAKVRCIHPFEVTWPMPLRAKGKGMILLLHGESGTGKTLTAGEFETPKENSMPTCLQPARNYGQPHQRAVVYHWMC